MGDLERWYLSIFQQEEQGAHCVFLYFIITPSAIFTAIYPIYGASVQEVDRLRRAGIWVCGQQVSLLVFSRRLQNGLGLHAIQIVPHQFFSECKGSPLKADYVGNKSAWQGGDLAPITRRLALNIQHLALEI